LVRTMTDNEEGKFVADTIKEQKLRNHYYNKDFAILYRTNAQSRAFEESLRRMNIAYKIYGGLSFYQRKEVKDMIAYLRIIVNGQDEEALKRIINFPVRGIGKTTIEKCVIIANEQNITMYDVVRRAGEFGFKAGTLEALNNFTTMIRYFQSMLTDKNAYDVAVQVGKHTNIVKELFNDKTTEGLQRYENVQELLNSIKEWTESPANDDGEMGDKSLGSYLQQITLLTDADKDDGNEDVVKLMTIHAAKGLEFGCVFVGGVEETLFPNAMAINTREELEEERRLFYVAVTRAKDRLWITYAGSRYRFGQLVQNEPSRFLEEMPKELLDTTHASGNGRGGNGFGGGFNNSHRSGFAANDAEQAAKKYGAPPAKKSSPYTSATSAIPKLTQHIPTGNFESSDVSDMEVGNKIEHQKFGFGTIKKIEGSSHNPIATIEFELNGERKIMLNYAKLRIVK